MHAHQWKQALFGLNTVSLSHSSCSFLKPLSVCLSLPAKTTNRDGDASSPAAQALKAQLVSSLGAQNVLLYAVEGLREVTLSVMAGLAFVTTGNLAAPLAGSVAVQVRERAAGCRVVETCYGHITFRLECCTDHVVCPCCAHAVAVCV